MVYAYDQNIQYPVKDLYDNQIIAMNIAAAKDMYEKGQQEIKDFQKEYGDFYSPFKKDMARYGQIIGGVKDIINNLYANGIDPIRSAEGRAAVSRAIASVDPSEINNMRANAKMGYAYLDALQKLNSQGKYDPNMQNAYLRSQGLPTFEDFSSEGGNLWTQSSPMEAITLRDLTSPGFAHRAAHELTKEQAMREMGSSYDSRAKYIGFTYDDLFDTAGTLVPGLRGDWRAEYFRNISAQKALARNPNATQADIDRQFQADIAEANRQWIIEPTGNLSDWYQQQNLDLNRQKVQLARQRASRQNNPTPNPNGWTTRQKTAVMLNYKQNVGNLPKNPSPSKYYGLLQTIPQGADKTTALAFVAGISNPEQVTVGMSQKRLPMMFGGNDLSITKKRQYAYSDMVTGGVQKNKLGMAVRSQTGESIQRNIVNQFDKFLKTNHVSGYIPSTDVTVNYNADENGTDIFDINAFSRVEKDDLRDYFDNDNKFVNQGSMLGLVAVLKNGRRIAVDNKHKGELKWANIEYVDIPVTRTINSIGYGNSVLDTYHDTMTLGKNVGAKRQSKYEEDDLEDLE